MKEILQTVYVQTQGAYLRLKDENMCLDYQDEPERMVPLHHIAHLVVFGNVLISPFLICKLADQKKSVAWMSATGRFYARSEPPPSRSVHLRIAQHQLAQQSETRLQLARHLVAGKMQNQKVNLSRSARDASPEDAQVLREAAKEIAVLVAGLPLTKTVEEVNGLEGAAAATYFKVFGHMLKKHRDFFWLTTRSRRPARDPINALLNYIYKVLENDCVSACTAVGLDPQLGFMHRPRSGRASLALDLMEEFRAPMADRAIITLINLGQLTPSDFEIEGQAVTIKEKARQTIIAHYVDRKSEEITHKFLGRKMLFGLIPHIQAQLLARYLRGDQENYPPYIYR